jgi:hypothetical protein
MFPARRSPWIHALVLALVLAAIAGSVWTLLRRAEAQPAVLAPRPEPEPASVRVAAVDAAARERASGSTASAVAPAAVQPAAEPEPSRLDEVLGGLRKLRPNVRFWPAGQDDTGFDQTDMSGLRRIVIELRVQAGELLALFARPDIDDADRALLFAAFAYVAAPAEVERQAVLDRLREQIRTHVRDSGASVPSERAVVAVAGLFALHMSGSHAELGSAASELVERALAPAATDVDVETAKQLGAFALKQMEASDSADARRAIDRAMAATLDPELHRAGWIAAARTFGPADFGVIIGATEQRSGASRAALAFTRNAAMVEPLVELIGRAPAAIADRATQREVLESAARGLLTIDDERSAEVYQGLLDSPDGAIAAAAWNAFQNGTTAGAPATSIAAATTARERKRASYFAIFFEQNAQLCRYRAWRATLSKDERARWAVRLRGVVPRVAGDPQSLQLALESFALVADADQRDTVEAYVAALLPEARAAFEEAWLHAHPRRLEPRDEARAR